MRIINLHSPGANSSTACRLCWNRANMARGSHTWLANICIFALLWVHFDLAIARAAGCPKIQKPVTDSPTIADIANVPSWWDNTLGSEQTVLPGFSPISVSGTLVRPAGRIYEWQNGYFPYVISSKGGLLARAMRLTTTVRGVIFEFKPSQVRVTAHSEAFVEIHATGEPIPHLRVDVDTRIEYDGVAMSTIRLTPTKPVEIEGLDFRVEVLDTPAMEIIGFKAESINQQKKRNDIMETPYTGDFINVVGMADGERSFWWFADNAEGWIWNASTVTEVNRTQDSIELRQRLIGDVWRIESPMSFKVNFLATPIRSLPPDWRGFRILAGPASNEEATLGSRINPWWTSAFAYDTYPYLELTPEARRKVPPADQKTYPGLDANAKLLQGDLERYNIHRLPYFSAHALSELDKTLHRYKSEWGVYPPRIYKDVVGPYAKTYEKPILTHRARSYSNYLLFQLNDAIRKLNIQGIYFDHGPPAMSCNKKNGGWKDSKGRWQPSLDILGMREFLKRLRVLFTMHGRAGYILIHNSNREVIPAYTFAYATVDGEQYRGGQVLEGDFLETVSLDELRTRLSPDQYGIPVIWLPVEWTYHIRDKNWIGSTSQRTAYRRHMALALTHGILDWPKGAHPSERKKLIRLLDDFGISNAEFVGYWGTRNPFKLDTDSARVSAYLRNDNNSLLAIVMNVTKVPITARLNYDSQKHTPETRFTATTESGTHSANASSPSTITLQIAPRDFQWVLLKQH